MESGETKCVVSRATWLLLYLSIRFGAAQQCISADNVPGSCVNLANCAPIVQMAQNTQFSSVDAFYSYLSQSLCGFDGNDLLVCCATSQSNYAAATNGPPTAPFTFIPLGVINPPGAPATIATPTAVAPLQPILELPPSALPSPAPGPPPASLLAPAAPSAQLVRIDDVCGISNFTSTRVVGGSNAKLNQYPWIAALAYRSGDNNRIQFLCAGSLVTQRHILTTAHCVNDNLAYARLGEYDLASDTDGATPQDVQIVSRTVHEDYVANLILNDIAMLVLGAAVPISAQIRPICLPVDEPLRSKDLTGYTPFLAGWGSAGFQAAAPTILQETQVPVVPTADCARNYQTYFPTQTFDDRILCAGAGGRDACQGDSGGPLMLPTNLPTGSYYYVLIGIVSYGYECAREGFPGVYTRVTTFLPWIQSHMA